MIKINIWKSKNWNLQKDVTEHIIKSSTFWAERGKWKPTFPISTRFVSITIVEQFSCQIIRQKSFNVCWVGPFKKNIKETI